MAQINPYFPSISNHIYVAKKRCYNWHKTPKTSLRALLIDVIPAPLNKASNQLIQTLPTSNSHPDIPKT